MGAQLGTMAKEWRSVVNASGVTGAGLGHETEIWEDERGDTLHGVRHESSENHARSSHNPKPLLELVTDDAHQQQQPILFDPSPLSARKNPLLLFEIRTKSKEALNPTALHNPTPKMNFRLGILNPTHMPENVHPFKIGSSLRLSPSPGDRTRLPRTARNGNGKTLVGGFLGECGKINANRTPPSFFEMRAVGWSLNSLDGLRERCV